MEVPQREFDRATAIARITLNKRNLHKRGSLKEGETLIVSGPGYTAILKGPNAVVRCGWIKVVCEYGEFSVPIDFQGNLRHLSKTKAA